MSLRFTVFGPPAAQGSKTAVKNRHGTIVGSRESSNRVMPFRQACASAAVAAGARIIEGPVRMDIVVHAVRPASHFRKDGTLVLGAPMKPGGHDASKVCRAVEDALARICYANDRAVRTLSIDFRYGDGPERVEVEIGPCA